MKGSLIVAPQLQEMTREIGQKAMQSSENEMLKEIVEAARYRDGEEVNSLIFSYVTTAKDSKEAVKEILLAALETKDIGIIGIVTWNGVSPNELKGEKLKEVLEKSIETNKPNIVNLMLRSINGWFRSGVINSRMDKDQLQELLIKALETKNSDIAVRYAKEVKLNNLSEKNLNKVVDLALKFETNNTIFKIMNNAVINKVKFPASSQEKMLDVALKTKDDYFINYMIKHGDNGKEAVEKILNYANENNDITLIMKLYENTQFDKESFNLIFGNIMTSPEYNLDRMDEKHYSFFIKLSEKADLESYKTLLLDNQMGENINNVLMTQIMCHTIKSKTFETIEEKNMASKVLNALRDAEMRLNDRDIKKESPNLVEQVLSLKSNNSLLIEFQELVYKSYEDVVQESLDKNPEIKAKFPFEQYQKSMKRSQDFIRRPEDFKLDSLTSHIADFVVVPLYVPGHCFGGFIRKLEDGNFSMTAINLGARPFEKGSHSYMEFVFDNKEKLQSIIDKYGYADFKGKTDINTCYKEFKEKSKEFYTLATASRLQKTGNCFTKNPEKCVRYGLSLILENMKNSEFKQENIREKSEFRPTHLKKLVGGKIRINEIIVERLSETFPEKKIAFERILETYISRKKYHIKGQVRPYTVEEPNYKFHPFIFRHERKLGEYGVLNNRVSMNGIKSEIKNMSEEQSKQGTQYQSKKHCLCPPM